MAGGQSRPSEDDMHICMNSRITVKESQEKMISMIQTPGVYDVIRSLSLL